MGRKLRHLLIFLLIILKPTPSISTPEADCGSACKSLSSRRCRCIKMGLTSFPQDLPAYLSILQLFDNNITSLSQSGLKGHSKLRTLHLSSNHMTNIKAGTFTNVPNLEELLLNHNLITSIQPGAFSNLLKLTKLSLHVNRIMGIQPGVFSDLPKLTNLLLNYNQITNIHPGAFSNLPELTTCDLAHNKISIIQQGVFSHRPMLGYLCLFNNQITTIQPGAFSNLPRLRKLELYENQISGIWPGVFSNLPMLTRLQLSSNKITEIQSGAFSDLPMLKELYIHSNRITDIQPGAFANLPKLKILKLETNQITEIRSNTLSNLPQLKCLHLHYNNITELNPSAFSNLPKLEGLDLFNNQISVLHPSAFGWLASIRQVRIQHNPWLCDCGIVPFRLKMNGSHSFENQMLCSKPAIFNGKLLIHIKPEDLICKEVTTPTMAPLTTLPANPRKIPSVPLKGKLVTTPTVTPLTTLSVNPSTISTVPVVGRLENGNNSYNRTKKHTSRYQWCFKQNIDLTARPVAVGTKVLLTINPREPESNSSHEPGLSFPLPVLIASVCGPVAGIVLIGAIIIWFKKKTKNTPSDQHPQIDRSQLSMAQLAALKSNPLYGDVQTPKNRLQPSDGAGSVKSLEHPNCTLDKVLSNTQNTATVTAVTNEHDSHHYEDIDIQNDQTRHSQSQAIIESNKHSAASVYEPKNENGQKGLDPSQATSQSLPPGVTNLQRNALLAALQPNPMYFDVKTATKKPSSSNMSSGHSQTGQGQSLAFTESNTHTTDAVVTSGHDNEYEDVDKLHDQTGQGQSRANTESNTHTTATAVTSSINQTGQAQSKVPTDELLGDKNLTYNTEPATMEPNPMYANDQTGQSQPQASTDESLGDRNLLYTTEPATLEPNSLYSNDNTGQGQSEATAEKSRDTRNVIYSTESPASPYTYLQK